ncbi:MAG TPA: DNA replication/repair protein RecF [bacterium]|nr:DNA replication/repair protein RecF [bacterium]
MKLISIELSDFRNYDKQEIIFSPNKNFIIGKNAQGKTNLLESIYLLCLSKSFRTSKEKEAIAFSKEQFIIKGVFELDIGIHQKVVLICSKSNGKQISVNRKSVSRMADFIGSLPVVISSPEEYELTNGPPPHRRRLVDILLSQINKRYIHSLIEYQRIIKQKSAILQKGKLHGKINIKEIEPWNERLIEVGAKIIEQRDIFSKELSTILTSVYSNLIINGEKLEFYYQPDLEYENIDDIKEKIATKLNQLLKKEQQRGICLVGPHRDDYIFKINGKNLKKFGSRGQHKTVLISLAIAEYQLIKNILNTEPILLIDDLYSELDSDREQKITQTIDQLGQVFITSTVANQQNMSDNKNICFTVNNGIVQKN